MFGYSGGLSGLIFDLWQCCIWCLICSCVCASWVETKFATRQRMSKNNLCWTWVISSKHAKEQLLQAATCCPCAKAHTDGHSERVVFKRLFRPSAFVHGMAMAFSGSEEHQMCILYRNSRI